MCYQEDVLLVFRLRVEGGLDPLNAMNGEHTQKGGCSSAHFVEYVYYACVGGGGYYWNYKIS